MGLYETGARLDCTMGSKREPHSGRQRTHNPSTEGSTTMSDHKAEDMKGRLKEAAGDLTGDKEPAAGRSDRPSQRCDQEDDR